MKDEPQIRYCQTEVNEICILKKRGSLFKLSEILLLFFGAEI